jgi:hypothetical protein
MEPKRNRFAPVEETPTRQQTSEDFQIASGNDRPARASAYLQIDTISEVNRSSFLFILFTKIFA